MRILLIKDAWHPQVNGVVSTWERVRAECQALDHASEVIAPNRFRTWPCPTYPEIRLAIAPAQKLRALVDRLRPDVSTSRPRDRSGSPLAASA